MTKIEKKKKLMLKLLKIEKKVSLRSLIYFLTYFLECF